MGIMHMGWDGAIAMEGVRWRECDGASAMERVRWSECESVHASAIASN